jgi:hypothetical protein
MGGEPTDAPVTDVAAADVTARCDACVPEVVREGLFKPTGLATDGTELFVAEGVQRSIYAIPLADLRNDAGVLRKVAENLPTEPAHIAVDAVWVYFGTTLSDAGTIHRVPKAGSASPQRFVPCEGPCPGVAVRGDRLYFTDRGADELFEVLIADGARRGLGFELATNHTLDYVEDVDIGPTGFYVADDRADTVIRFHPDAGVANAVSVKTPAGVAVADDGVWVASEDAGIVTRFPHDLSAPGVVIAEGLRSPVGVVATDDAVYWVARFPGAIWRIRR